MSMMLLQTNSYTCQ